MAASGLHASFRLGSGNEQKESPDAEAAAPFARAILVDTLCFLPFNFDGIVLFDDSQPVVSEHFCDSFSDTRIMQIGNSQRICCIKGHLVMALPCILAKSVLNCCVGLGGALITHMLSCVNSAKLIS